MGYLRRILSQKIAQESGDQIQEILPQPPINPEPKTAKELIPGPPATINPQAAPAPHFLRRAPGTIPNKWIDFHNPVSGGTLLSNDNTVNTYNANWKPKYWIVKAVGTAGYVNIHGGSGRAGRYVRLDRGTAIQTDGRNATITIETVGFSGFYDVYGTDDLNEFDIKA